MYMRVLESMTEGVSLSDETGTILYTNPAEDRIFGYQPGELIGQHVTVQNAYPEQENQRRVSEVIQELKTQGSWSGEWLNRRKDGTPFYTYARITAIELDQRQYWVCVQEDITERRRRDEERDRLERQLTLLVEASGALMASPHPSEVSQSILSLAQQFVTADAYAVWRGDSCGTRWTVVSAVGLSEEFQAEAALAGRGPITVLEQPLVIEDVSAEPALQQRRASHEREGIRSMLAVPLRIQGSVKGTIVFYYFQVHPFSEAEVRVAVALGNLAASALGTAEMYERQTAMRVLAQRAEQRARFLAEAGETLASTLDYETTLKRLARLAIPAFADWSVVDVWDRGQLHRVAIEHSDPAKVAWAETYRQMHPPQSDDPSQTALRTGKSVLLRQIPGEWIGQRVPDPEQRRQVDSLGLRSAILVPMTARGRSLGLLAFFTAESGREYTDEDLTLAEELARRAALAVDNSRLHAEVQQSEHRLKQIVETAAEGICMLDADGKVTFANPRMSELVGCSPDELIGQSLVELVPDEERDRARAGFARRIEGDSGPPRAYPIRHRDGSIRWLQIYASLIRSETGAFKAVLGMFTDITEARRAEAAVRQSEARFRLMADSAPVLVWLADTDKLCTWFNRPWLEFTGRTMEQECGNGWQEGVHPDDAATCVSVYTDAFDRRVEFRMEYRLRRHDGAWRWVIDHGLPLFGADGEFNGYIGSCIDITERRAMEEELRRSNEALRSTNEDLNEFAYAASHDLQEPLRMVGLYAQLVNRRYRDRLDDEAKDFLGIVEDGARRMQALVDGLLTFTRAGDTLAEPLESVSVESALESALANLRRSIDRSGAQITHDPLPTVTAHPARIVQILQNLVGNAIKYSRDGVPPRIHLRAEPHGDQWLFALQDNGVGIDPRFHEQVFGVFRRLDQSKPGTGIGLALCARVVARYGGRIWLESDGLGNGSTFFFTLPR